MSTLLVTSTTKGRGMPHLPLHVHFNWEIKASLNMGPAEEIKHEILQKIGWTCEAEVMEGFEHVL
jgi:hypothetical protein